MKDNKATWIAEHALAIFIVFAVLIVGGGAAVVYTFEKQGDTADKVKVLRPQVTRINRAICDNRSLESKDRARRCAERIRVGLINCRRSTRCRAAYLALATYPPPAKPPPAADATSSPEPSPGSPRDTRGGDAQQPSNNGHQQPGPGKGPEPSVEPSPAPSPGQGGADRGEAPGGDQGGGGESSSKPDVEVEACVLEQLCVDAEVGAGLGP